MRFILLSFLASIFLSCEHEEMLLHPGPKPAIDTISAFKGPGEGKGTGDVLETLPSE